MTYAEVLNILAPCGLDCTRCVRFAEGPIKQTATQLRAQLAGFENMAARLADRVPAIQHYAEFAAVLEFLTQGECTGCRQGGAKTPFCAAKDCFREKGVDFCFQCDEYPCRRNHYPPHLEQRWRAYNDRMREIGVERFCEEQRTKPRY